VVLFYFSKLIYQFSDVVAEVGIINKPNLARFWLLTKYERKITSLHIFGYLLEQGIEIWQFFLKIFWILATFFFLSKGH
jgi:hypothetical protein